MLYETSLIIGGLRSESPVRIQLVLFCACLFLPSCFHWPCDKGFTSNELFLLDTSIWKYSISFPPEVTDWSSGPGRGDRGCRRVVATGLTQHASRDFKVLLTTSERSGELLLESMKKEEDGRVFSHPVISTERQAEGALRPLLPDVLESQRATQGRDRWNIGEFLLYCLPIKL